MGYCLHDSSLIYEGMQPLDHETHGMDRSNITTSTVPVGNYEMDEGEERGGDPQSIPLFVVQPSMPTSMSIFMYSHSCTFDPHPMPSGDCFESTLQWIMQEYMVEA